MFDRTQRRLTLQYSAVLIAFMLLFAFIVYGLLNFLLIYDQRTELINLLDEEANVITGAWQKHGINTGTQGLSNDLLNNESQIFYSFIDHNEQVIYQNELDSLDREEVLSRISTWSPDSEDTKFRTIKITSSAARSHGWRGGMTNESGIFKDQGMVLLTAARNVYHEGQTIGTLYVGKDMTSEYALFRMLLIVLIGIGAVFCGFAVYLSHRMSRKAMNPIIESYHRQREFVADASHELRTPLSVILSSVDTLELEDPLRNDPFIKGILSNMKDETKRMAALTGGLLTLARSDIEANHKHMEKINMSRIAEQAARNFKNIAEKKQISFAAEIPEDLMLRGDEGRLMQLIVILLDNAIKYTPEGGEVRLKVSEAYYRHTDQVFVSVSDTGVGIPLEEQKHIFKRFYRVEKSRSRDYGGYGLGLSIAQAIVLAHQGRIHVESAPGHGSVFTAVFPK